ncbi:hypothetical protein EDB19DRAFT_1831145, partial [Suillus lakei]
GGATTGTATDTSADLDPLTAEQPKGPRRTTRRHVPSKHEQALNIIGSSNARIHAAVGGTEGKENDESTFLPTKRKVKPTNQQASNGEVLFSDDGPHTPSISLDTHHGDSLRISSNTHPRLSIQLYTTLVVNQNTGDCHGHARLRKHQVSKMFCRVTVIQLFDIQQPYKHLPRLTPL